MSGSADLGSAAVPPSGRSGAERVRPVVALRPRALLRAGGADDEAALRALVAELRGELARGEDARAARVANRAELELMVESMP